MHTADKENRESALEKVKWQEKKQDFWKQNVGMSILPSA